MNSVRAVGGFVYRCAFAWLLSCAFLSVSALAEPPLTEDAKLLKSLLFDKSVRLTVADPRQWTAENLKKWGLRPEKLEAALRELLRAHPELRERVDSGTAARMAAIEKLNQDIRTRFEKDGLELDLPQRYMRSLQVMLQASRLLNEKPLTQIEKDTYAQNKVREKFANPDWGSDEVQRLLYKAYSQIEEEVRLKRDAQKLTFEDFAAWRAPWKKVLEDQLSENFRAAIIESLTPQKVSRELLEKVRWTLTDEGEWKLEKPEAPASFLAVVDKHAAQLDGRALDPSDFGAEKPLSESLNSRAVSRRLARLNGTLYQMGRFAQRQTAADFDIKKVVATLDEPARAWSSRGNSSADLFSPPETHRGLGQQFWDAVLAGDAKSADTWKARQKTGNRFWNLFSLHPEHARLGTVRFLGMNFHKPRTKLFRQVILPWMLATGLGVGTWTAHQEGVFDQPLSWAAQRLEGAQDFLERRFKGLGLRKESVEPQREIEPEGTEPPTPNFTDEATQKKKKELPAIYRVETTGHRPNFDPNLPTHLVAPTKAERSAREIEIASTPGFKVTLTNSVPIKPVDGQVPLPLFPEWEVQGLTIRTDKGNLKYKTDYTFGVSEHGHTVVVLKDPTVKSVWMDISFAHDDAYTPEAPPVLVDPDRVLTTANELRSGGFSVLASAFEKEAKKAKEEGRDVLLDKLIAHAKSSSDYVYEKPIPDARRGEGIFAEYTKYVVGGRFCTQCSGMSAFHAKVLGHLLGDHTGVEVRAVSGYLLDHPINGRIEIRPGNKHAFNAVSFPDGTSGIFRDATPGDPRHASTLPSPPVAVAPPPVTEVKPAPQGEKPTEAEKPAEAAKPTEQEKAETGKPVEQSLAGARSIHASLLPLSIPRPPPVSPSPPQPRFIERRHVAPPNRSNEPVAKGPALEPGVQTQEHDDLGEFRNLDILDKTERALLKLDRLAETLKFPYDAQFPETTANELHRRAATALRYLREYVQGERTADKLVSDLSALPGFPKGLSITTPQELLAALRTFSADIDKENNDIERVFSTLPTAEKKKVAHRANPKYRAVISELTGLLRDGAWTERYEGFELRRTVRVGDRDYVDCRLYLRKLPL